MQIVACCPVTGSDQKNQTFWKRVHEDFVAKHLSSEERTQQGLQSCWSHIQRQVNHFCTCFAKVEAREESGKTFEDKVSKTSHTFLLNTIASSRLADAKRLFKVDQGTPFNLDHCWNVLRNTRKWAETTAEKEKREKWKEKRKEVDEAQCVDDGSNKENDENTLARPSGRKREKELKRRRPTSAERYEAMAQRQSELVELTRRKTEALEGILEQSIMDKDLTGMDELSREYYLQKKRHIMEKLKQ